MASAFFFCIWCRLCKLYSVLCHIKPTVEVDILAMLESWNFVCIVVCKWMSKCSEVYTSCVICSQMLRHPSVTEHVQPSGILSIWMGTDGCHSSKIRQRPLVPSTCRSVFAPGTSVNSSGLWHSSFMFLSSVTVVHSLCYVMWCDNWRCGKHLPKLRHNSLKNWDWAFWDCLYGMTLEIKLVLYAPHI